LNLSDALIRTHYTLPPALDVNYCPHHRVRNADGLARVCIAQNQGITDLRGWANRPSWNAIVFFEGGPRLSGATGHIDLYDGSTRNALHATYQDAAAVSFWKLG